MTGQKDGARGGSGTGRMDGTWFSAARAVLICMSLSCSLLGCAAPVAKDAVQLSGSRIALLQSADARADGGTVSVQMGVSQPGDTRTIPLAGLVAARIEGAWVVGSYRLLLISGSTRDCPWQTSLLITANDTGQLRALGNCNDRFMFTLSGGQWSARQTNVRDPASWVFQDGTLSGPIVASATGGRRGKQGAATSAFEQERTPDSDHPGEPDRAQSPVQPPQVSRPVGDDVVPPPVGAGPLPGRAQPAPRVF